MDLEDAVAAHPHKCLRALAMTWGLQYSVLERLERPLQHEGLRRHQKRKAETDNGSRRIRAREDQDSDSAAGSESTSLQDVDSRRSSQDVDDQRSPQDSDDQRSQPSRVVSVQVRVPARTEGGYGDLIERILAAADRQERRRDEVEDPFYGEHIGWGYDSPTTTERRRNRMRHPNGRLVYTSKILGRH